MSKPDTPQKNSSTVSTIYNTNYHSVKTSMYNTERRPKTANLVYANKPYKKQMANWNQSSSTWQHSNRRHAFPKDQRFKTILPYSLDILQPQLEAPASKKAPTMGYGHRTPISETILRNAKQKPSPNAYSMSSIDEMTRSPRKGRSFSSNWSKEQKRYLSHRKDVYNSHFVNDNPPAKYDVTEKIGKNKRAYTAYGRLKMFTDKMADSMRDVPGPSYLLNDRHLYSTLGFQNCSFTDGERLDLSAPANDFPGSQYLIPGFCDRFKVTRRKNCPD